MIFVEERSLLEVADHFGVSESRICQRVNSMRARMRDHYLSHRLQDRYRTEESFGVLEVSWIGW